jgi:TRAP-type mannitol/chloroaromatic compound transport system permease large subunit
MNIPLTVFLLCFILTFIIRLPIALGMLMSSVFYCLLAPGPAVGLQMAARQFLGGLNVKFILIAVPLFVFAAKVMNSGAVTERYDRFRGGRCIWSGHYGN